RGVIGRAAGHRGRAGILLRAIHTIRETVVGADVVHLRGRLVVPARPGLAAVGGDDRALVDAHDLAVRIVRIDPQLVVIIPGRVALHGQEGLAAIIRTQLDGVHRVDAIGIFRIGGDLPEIPAALPNARIAAHLLPGLAGIVGAVQTALLRIDDC